MTEQIAGWVSRYHKPYIYVRTGVGLAKKYQYDTYLPLMPGDVISFTVDPLDNVLTGPPHVLINCSQESVKSYCQQALGWRAHKADLTTLLLNLERRATCCPGHDWERVVYYLEDYAHQYQESRLVEEITPLSEKQAIKLYRFIYLKISVRRLMLLGCTRLQVYELAEYFHGLPLHQIYYLGLRDPHLWVPLPLTLIKKINQSLGFTPTPLQEKASQVARGLWALALDGVDGQPYSRLVLTGEVVQYLADHYQVGLVESKLGPTWMLPIIKKAHLFLKEYLQRLAHQNTKTVTTVGEGLSQKQQAALSSALSHKLTLITGAAGSGKSTIIGQLIKVLSKDGQPLVTSFTGKAVSRLRQITGQRTIYTIHRNLTMKPDPKLFNAVIIDECSMMTTYLFFRLLEFLEAGQAADLPLILVGDPNQLQPIGWGRVFQDLLQVATTVKWPSLAWSHLTEVFRAGSGILHLANCVLKTSSQRPYRASQDRQLAVFGDVSLLASRPQPTGDPDLCSLKATLTKLSKGLSAHQMVVVTPYSCNLNSLNQAFKDIFYPRQTTIQDTFYRHWYAQQRVMMTENIYRSEYSLFNGDEGIVVRLDQANGQIFVQFEHQCVAFKLNNALYDELADDDQQTLTTRLLTPSFAVTIHKSQGSEWPYVILYLPYHTANSRFLEQRLVYTALTRAKEGLVVVGKIGELDLAINRKTPLAYSFLADVLTN